MTLQQLEYFLAALDEGSFSAAAERLLLAQPSLSEQIRRLEAELGVALFTRVGRGIRPTDAARALRPHAEAALGAVAEGREAVVEQRELQGGIATFGTFGTARWYPGTQIVSAFRKRHPKVRVRMVGQNSSEVGDRRARRRPGGGPGRAADRRQRPGGPADHAGRDPLRQRGSRARQEGRDDPRARRRAADPHRHELRPGGPDASPALRAGPARGRHDRAPDRRRGRRDRDRARRPRPRRRR